MCRDSLAVGPGETTDKLGAMEMKSASKQTEDDHPSFLSAVSTVETPSNLLMQPFYRLNHCRTRIG
jgi:hypothetical protein